MSHLVLLALGEKLGIARERWPAREGWHEIKAPETVTGSGQIAGCKDELLAALEVFGAALSVSLAVASIDDEGNFDRASWTAAADDADADRLAAYLQQFIAFPDLELRLNLRLDKLAYAEALLARPSEPTTRVTVFLFPRAFALLFSSFEGLRQLDEEWGDDPDERWLCLLPGWRTEEPAEARLLSGPRLTLFGGDPGELPALAAGSADGVALRRMHELRDEQFRWETRWLERLTPFHLALRGNVEAADPIVAPLRWQFALLAVLYTADRVRGGAAADSKPEVAVYQGADRRLEVRLVEPGGALEVGSRGLSDAGRAGVEAWDHLCRWCYQAEGSVGDRLATVQNVVCREAWGTAPENAFRVLLTRAPTILGQARHNWKSFIEEQVDTFFGQMQSLEEHVASTVRDFAEHTGKLIDQISSTVLAAVGVLLGALLLPSIDDGNIDPGVVAVSMLVYALYVLVFPTGYGLTSQWQAHRALERGFDERYERFKRQLPTHLVEQVGRREVDRAVGRFHRWFMASVVTYAVLLVLLVVGALLLGVFTLLYN